MEALAPSVRIKIFSYYLYPPVGAVDFGPDIRVYNFGWPANWVETCWKPDYIQIDPVPCIAERRTLPFWWSGIEKVAGVVCHLAHFDRSVWDRLGKGNWFENPSNSSISCLQAGPITVGRIDTDKSGEEVFDESQSLVFKQLAVRRIYDAGSDSLMCVSFSRTIVDGSAKISLSTVPLYGREVTWTESKPAAEA